MKVVLRKMVLGLESTFLMRKGFEKSTKYLLRDAPSEKKQEARMAPKVDTNVRRLLRLRELGRMQGRGRETLDLLKNGGSR